MNHRYTGGKSSVKSSVFRAQVFLLGVAEMYQLTTVSLNGAVVPLVPPMPLYLRPSPGPCYGWFLTLSSK